MLQLNPPIPFVDDKGRKCTAYLVLDYSQEHDTLFFVGYDDDRTLWWLPNSRLRLPDNISLGRRPSDAGNQNDGGPFLLQPSNHGAGDREGRH